MLELAYRCFWWSETQKVYNIDWRNSFSHFLINSVNSIVSNDETKLLFNIQISNNKVLTLDKASAFCI